MATAAEIVESAAEVLGIVGEGEMLTSYESGDLTQAYLEVYNILQARNLITWAYTSDIPDEYVWPVTMLVAEARATKYQIPQELYARIRSEASGDNDNGRAILMLRELQARSQMGTTEIENF